MTHRGIENLVHTKRDAQSWASDSGHSLAREKELSRFYSFARLFHDGSLWHIGNKPREVNAPPYGTLNWMMMMTGARKTKKRRWRRRGKLSPWLIIGKKFLLGATYRLSNYVAAVDFPIKPNWFKVFSLLICRKKLSFLHNCTHLTSRSNQNLRHSKSQVAIDESLYHVYNGSPPRTRITHLTLFVSRSSEIPQSCFFRGHDNEIRTARRAFPRSIA